MGGDDLLVMKRPKPNDAMSSDSQQHRATRRMRRTLQVHHSGITAVGITAVGIPAVICSSNAPQLDVLLGSGQRGLSGSHHQLNDSGSTDEEEDNCCDRLVKAEVENHSG